VFIPASGWLGDRFGTRRVFLTALAIFTLAPALCGLAQTLMLSITDPVHAKLGITAAYGVSRRLATQKEAGRRWSFPLLVGW
jgi:MFS family permease